MGETIFRYEHGQGRGADAFSRKVTRREYYEGEYQIAPRPGAKVLIEKGLDADFSIIRLTSTVPLKFRRDWPHIRNDRLDVCVVWFVEKGAIAFSHGDRTDVIAAGNCAVTRSLQPFRMECHPDDASAIDVLHVIVPTHMMIDHFPEDIRPGTSISSTFGDCRLALKTFWLLHEEGQTISRRAADGLAREALRAIGALFTPSQFATKLTAIDRRYEDILTFVSNHLTNQDLSMAMVANGVGISPSYLMQVLKKRDSSFSKLLWSSRTQRARNLLLAESADAFSIKQVAMRSGFKSQAHFARVFKAATGIGPREFRKQSLPSVRP